MDAVMKQRWRMDAARLICAASDNEARAANSALAETAVRKANPQRQSSQDAIPASPPPSSLHPPCLKSWCDLMHRMTGT